MATIPSVPTVVAGQKLTAAAVNNIGAGIAFLVAPPLCVITASVAQSITTSTITPVTFDTESTDIDNMHSNTTNPTRVTGVTAGWYSVTAAGTFAANATGSRFGSLTLNGSAEIARVEVAANAASGRGSSVVTTAMLFLNVGDYFEYTVWQSSGAALAISGQRLSALWIHT